MNKQQLGSGDSVAGKSSVSPPKLAAVVDLYSVAMGYSDHIAQFLPDTASRTNDLVEFEPLFKTFEEACAFAKVISDAHSLPAFVYRNSYTYSRSNYVCVVDTRKSVIEGPVGLRYLG